MVVYPRWRGELFCALAFCWLSRGLSPLARGTHQRYRLQLTGSRFIPAGAGNTGKTNIGVRVVPVYPRWRGEHSIRRFCSSSDAGLSPLARGTRCSVNIDGDVTRFIPAGAGNTFLRLFMRIKNSVYPRWRGEHRRGLTSRPSQTGLSPLARGTQLRRSTQLNKPRFIPAGAGNTDK